MIDILITGHGTFASGLASAAKLIAGSLAEIRAIDFDPSQNIDKLREAIKEAIAETTTQEILILADLLGGTPFNVAMVLKEDHKDMNIRVIAGANLAMLLDAVFSRNTPLGNMVLQVKAAGMDGIGEMEQSLEAEIIDEDGI